MGQLLDTKKIDMEFFCGVYG